MSTRFGHIDDYVTNDAVSSSDLDSRAKVLASQTNIAPLGVGVFPLPNANSFKVTASTGLSVSIAAGSGLAQESSIGYVALFKSGSTTLSSLDDDTAEIYIFATVEDATNKTYETGLPLFVADSLDTLDGGLLLAMVTTAGGAVTDVIDLRHLITPLNYLGAWNTDTRYKTNDAVDDSGTTWIALLDNDGVAPTEGATWHAIGGASVGHIIKYNGVAQTARSNLDIISTDGTATVADNAGANATEITFEHVATAVHEVAQPITLLLDEVEVGTRPVVNVITGTNMTIGASDNGTDERIDLTFHATQTPGYGGTSTTSLAIGTGTKSLTTDAGLAYVVGSRVRIINSADTTKWMEGVVTAYAGTAMDVLVDKTSGSGTLAAWNLSIGGEPGAAGATGAAGAGYGGTSTTSRAFTVGSKTFTTQAGLAYAVGARVRATLSTDTTKWMEGVVTAYSTTSLTILIDKIASGASGTYSSWIFNVAGEPGATGAPGTGDVVSAGVSGGQTINGGTGSGEHLQLYSTADATKGKIKLGANSAYDEANKRLGIGTQAPATEAEFVAPTGSDGHVLSTAYGGFAGKHIGRSARGTQGSPTASLVGDILALSGGRGYGATGFSTVSTARIKFIAAENFTDSAMGTYLTLETTPIGSVTPAEVMRLTTTAGVIIGGTSLNAAALVQLDSTTRGFLLPRMTTTQRDAISSPPDGLLIYSTTTHSLHNYQNGSWVDLASGGGGSGVSWNENLMLKTQVYS